VICKFIFLVFTLEIDGSITTLISKHMYPMIVNGVLICREWII